MATSPRAMDIAAAIAKWAFTHKKVLLNEFLVSEIIDEGLKDLVEERDKAVAYATKIDRGHVRLADRVNLEIVTIGNLLHGTKRFEENLSDTVDRILKELHDLKHRSLAERCFEEERDADELFTTLHLLLGGRPIGECTNEGFLWKLNDCWTDPYDSSVEIVVPQRITREQADSILALGFGQIYESCEGHGYQWTDKGFWNCNPREGDQEKQIRAERNVLLERLKTVNEQWTLAEQDLKQISAERDELRGQLKVATDALEEIGQYQGVGGPGTPWQDIVRDLGNWARTAMEKIKPTSTLNASHQETAE